MKTQTPLHNANPILTLVAAGLLPLVGQSRAELIAHWKLDETAGATIAADSSGNGRDADALGGATFGVEGVAGTAVEGDGTNDVASLSPNPLTGGGARTICAWFYVNDWTGDQSGIFGTPSAGSWSRFDVNTEIANGNNVIRFRFQGSNLSWSGNAEFGTESGFSESTWYHIAVRVPSAGLTFNDVEMFINGVELSSDEGNGSAQLINTSSTAPFTICHSAGELDGRVDDVQLYDYALTDDEILGIFENPGTIAGEAPSAPFAITEIDYSPDTDEVTLTWVDTGASYIAKYSTDMADWDADLDDGLSAANDERPEQTGHITVTFSLSDALVENEPDLFFRIEEE